MRRRSFLGALGMAPLAGAAAVKQEAASLAGVSHGVGSKNIGLAGILGGCDRSSSSTSMSWEDRLKKVSGYIAKNGVPEWKRQEILRDITVRHLDPDLAANRSFSLATKMRIQRDRQFAKEIEQMVETPKWGEAAQRFTEAMGFYL